MSHPVGNRLPRSASQRITDSTEVGFYLAFFFWLSFRFFNIPPLRFSSITLEAPVFSFSFLANERMAGRVDG
ncbi:hypothetical protein GHT06_022305 [Daphnia sinensis]|uniref:Uncharacterized protein n=1 Tax=Daphnia sinensis TaxID=1820382 RepID=A0AAD5PNK5_9CRUS|nr:hypothetical protein GHT06_022305 [Daphnia sinensis]